MTEPDHTEPDHTGRLVPPWDDATVHALNAFQAAGRMHPFTCPINTDHLLIATRDGWICEHDPDYRQPWAHTFMITLAEQFPPLPWHRITPENATHLHLPAPWIQGPLNEDGEPCPWPWEPQQRIGVAMGMYHCNYCGAMCLAGAAHPDYRDSTDDSTASPADSLDSADSADTRGVIQQ